MRDRGEGFKAREAVEYLGRKIFAVVLIITGLILGMLGVIAYVLSFLMSIRAILVAFIGFGLYLYGRHYWDKVTHVIWTRQALREYGVPSKFDNPDHQMNRKEAVGKPEPVNRNDKSQNPRSLTGNPKDNPIPQPKNKTQNPEVQPPPQARRESPPKKQSDQNQEYCPDCGDMLRWIEKYHGWYCDNCKEYKKVS